MIAILVSLALAPQLAASQNFQQALDAIRHGDFRQAESQAKAGLKLDPDSAAGYDLLGIAADGLRHSSDADRAFRTAIRLNSVFIPAHNDLARSLYRRGLAKEAIQEFQCALRLDQRNLTANYNLGLIARDQKRYADAVRYLEIAREIVPDPLTLFALAGAYLGAGDNDSAVAVSRELQAVAPDDTQVNFSLGTLFLEWKQYAEAAGYLERARIAEPRNFELLHDLGQAYTHLDKFAEAETAFRNALTLRGDAVETLYQLAILYARWEHPDQAIQVLVRSRQLAPKRADILLLLGRESIEEGFLDDAAEVLQQSISLDPDKVEPYLLLGEAFTRLKKYENALQEYQIMVRLDPRNPQSYVSLGRTYQYMRLYPESESALRKALSIDPRNTQAAYYMGLIASEQSDYAAAKRWYGQVLQVDPKHLAALYDMGVAAMREHDDAVALEYLVKAAAVAPTFSQVYYRLSVVYRRLKDSDEADQMFALFKKYEEADEERRSYRPHGVLDFVKETQDLPESQRLQRYREALSKAEQTHPDDLNVLFLEAQVDFRLGEKARAFERVARITSLQGGNAAVRMRAASLLTEFHCYQEALEHLQAAVEKQPDAEEPRFALAALYCRMQRIQEALHTLTSARSGPPKSAAFHNLLGRTLVLEGNPAVGLRELQIAADTEPNHESYWLDLAIELTAAGQPARAALALEKAKSKWPGSSRLVFAEGICDQLAGRTADAQTKLQKSADLAFQWEPPYLAQANLLRETDDITRSVATLDQAASLFPDSPWPHLFRALALSKTDLNHAEVALELKHTLELARAEPEVYAALLTAFLRQHECSQALDIWERMAPFGLAKNLDPGAACGKVSPEMLDRYPDWRWIVELARR